MSTKEEMTRGSVINGYLRGVKKKWGQQALDQIKEDTGIDPTTIKDGEYYPRESWNSLLHWISANKGIDVIEELGQGAFQNLGMLKYLVMWSSMERMIARVVSIYKEIYTYGSMIGYYEGDHIRIEMTDKNRIKENCYGFMGAFKGALTVTHTKGHVEEVQCSLDGAEKCIYHIYLD